MKQERLRITWVKSAIGYAEDQKATLKALGFKRLGQTLSKPDSPSLRGMLHKVRHLIELEETDETP